MNADIGSVLREYRDKASAGTGYFLFDAYPDSTIDITLNKTTEKANECIAVSGNSMEPMFYDGDILLVKRQVNIDEGQIGIFVKDGQGFVKKKGFDRLISLNPDYDDIYPYLYRQQVISITSGLSVEKPCMIIYIDFEED